MKLQNWAPVFIGVFMLAAPVLAMAQIPAPANTQTIPPPANTVGIPPPAVTQTQCAPNTVCNPLQFGTFCTLLKAIFNDILILGIPIATLFIVWAGFKLVLARGNEKELTDAKRNLWYIVIGIALFLGAWTLSQIIANTLAALGGGGGLC